MATYHLGEEQFINSDVLLTDTSNPNSVTQAAVDFIAAGYSDNDPADDEVKGAFTFAMIDERSNLPATILIGGSPVVASGVPMIVTEAYPTICRLQYNGPSQLGTYTCRLTYTKTGGLNEVITEWEEIWR